MNIIQLKKIITQHEGHKDVIYLDTLGYLTGGIGHLITKADGQWVVGQHIPPEQIEKWFEEDINSAIKLAETYVGSAYKSLCDERKIVIIDMSFNLGNKIHKFVGLKAALLLSRYDLAAVEMKNSKWATQVHNRATELINIMLTGKI